MSGETDVVVIGSGFGGSVAALRFAEAGQKVTVLERGPRVSREKYQADLDALWKPDRNSYGMFDLRFRGRNIVPMLGAAVGGGSHVYAGVLLRRDELGAFPSAIRGADMAPHYTLAEDILGVNLYPDHAPYSEVPQHRLMLETGNALAAAEPHLVEAHGRVPVGFSFAPADPAKGKPGEEFVNKHGCKQRYQDPREASLVGGDIDTKNSIDRNYLFLAEKRGAVVEPLCEVDKLERLPGDKWKVTYRRHLPSRGWSAFAQRWLTLHPTAKMSEEETLIAKRVVVAAGSIGSTQLLLRNRDVHKTIEIGEALGTRYTTNGDYLMLVVPFLRLVPIWLALLGAVAFAIAGMWIAVAVAALAYYGLLLASPPIEPDLGAPISTYIRFRGPKDVPGYAWIEGGTYPQPGRLVAAVVISAVTGRFRPRLYRALRTATRVLSFVILPFGAIVRSYPLPLLTMGRDQAVGTFTLDGDGAATLDYPIDDNKPYYEYVDGLGKKFARSATAWWLRNATYVLAKVQEVPHNQGGVPMGEDPSTGVVDHAGRVFGVPNLIVLDGSIIPESIGPNPALTIAALAERAMIIILAQIGQDDSPVVADVPAAPAAAPSVA